MKTLWDLLKFELEINEHSIAEQSKGNQMIIQKRKNTNFIYILKKLIPNDLHYYMLKSPFPIYKYLYN